MLSSFGYSELLLFGLIALMLFGSKLPDVARSFGRNYRDLRRKVDELQREFRDWDKPDYSRPDNPLTSQATSNEEFYRPSAPKFVPPKEDSVSDAV